jgi:hypothetical protein
MPINHHFLLLSAHLLPFASDTAFLIAVCTSEHVWTFQALAKSWIINVTGDTLLVDQHPSAIDSTVILSPASWLAYHKSTRLSHLVDCKRCVKARWRKRFLTCAQTHTINASAVLVAMIRTGFLISAHVFKRTGTGQCSFQPRRRIQNLAWKPAYQNHRSNQNVNVSCVCWTNRNITAVVERVGCFADFSEIRWEASWWISSPFPGVQRCIEISQFEIFINADRVGEVLDGHAGASESVGLTPSHWSHVPLTSEAGSLAEFGAVAVIDVKNGAALVFAPGGGLGHWVVDSGVPSGALEDGEGESADKRVFFSGCNHELIADDFALNMRSNQGAVLVFQQ